MQCLFRERAISRCRFANNRKHSGVVIRTDPGQPIRTQRRDRHRPGIIGVVLLRLARSQHPNPRRQHRWHIEHGLASRDQLLRQQIAEPVRRLDRPFPILETVPPTRSLLAWPG